MSWALKYVADDRRSYFFDGSDFRDIEIHRAKPFATREDAQTFAFRWAGWPYDGREIRPCIIPLTDAQLNRFPKGRWT